ncbi:unnamed protein product [Effrenium voratum]|nr:unnamed protein product [Effrenium voratum]
MRAVDLKQSSAEVTGDSPRELQVVLRKAVRNEVWDYAFEKTEACAEKEEAIALGLQAAPASEPAELERRPEAQQDAPEVVEDSAELDVAPPVVQDSTQAPVRQVEASPNAVQSAVVMGQSVLLQNRLMYQLL